MVRLAATSDSHFLYSLHILQRFYNLNAVDWTKAVNIFISVCYMEVNLSQAMPYVIVTSICWRPQYCVVRPKAPKKQTGCIL